MEAPTVKALKLYLAPGLVERIINEDACLVVYTTLKFSCMIAKIFSAEITKEVPDNAIRIPYKDIEVYLVFRAVGSKFCGMDIGFTEFDFPVKEPERFLPKWIRVEDNLSGEFGYA
jgi:hypothetical protein